MKLHEILNTKIENSGYLSAIGDFGLAPYRALWNGKTVAIINNESVEQQPQKMSRFLATALIIPGILLSIFKLAAYFLFSDVKEKFKFISAPSEELSKEKVVDEKDKIEVQNNNKINNDNQNKIIDLTVTTDHIEQISNGFLNYHHL